MLLLHPGWPPAPPPVLQGHKGDQRVAQPHWRHAEVAGSPHHRAPHGSHVARHAAAAQLDVLIAAGIIPNSQRFGQMYMLKPAAAFVTCDAARNGGVNAHCLFDQVCHDLYCTRTCPLASLHCHQTRTYTYTMLVLLHSLLRPQVPL